MLWSLAVLFYRSQPLPGSSKGIFHARSAPRLLKPRLGTVPGHGVQEMLHVMWACKDKYSQANVKYVILIIPNILNLNKS